MTVFGFNDKQNAEALNRFASDLRGKTKGPAPRLGEETLIVKVPDGETLAAAQGDTAESLDCEIWVLGTSGTLTDSGTTCEVWNYSDSAIEAGLPFTAVRGKSIWVAVPKGEGSDAPKRVKFKLDEPLLASGTLLSGYALASVIDPMNSGLAIGTTVTVYDYKKQFVMSTTDAIGIAVLDAPYTTQVEEEWHIEECEQLVNYARATLNSSCGPWLSGRTAYIDQALTSWPYVSWLAGELNSEVTYGNKARITAGIGKVNMRRVIPDAYLPNPDNEVCPYTLEPITTQWELVSAERPTARWCQTITPASGDLQFTLMAPAENARYWEGFSPREHDDMADGDAADPPAGIWAQMAPVKCHIKGGTIGHAYLDDNTGNYVTVTTASALFGMPEVVKMVAKKDALETDELIEPVAGECGKFEHESLSNALVWGNPDGGGSDCQMQQENPRPQVDVFESANDAEVVTGLAIDGNGDLEMVKVTIKACTTPASPVVLPLSQMDVVTDVSCGANGLTNSYKTVKYLGSELSSGGPVELECTNPNNYDWEYIFNNHVYNETWWNVDYYDITFPAGCEPCPTGCCTATAYPNGQGGITQAACEAETGYVSWTAGDCPDPTGCCTGGTSDGLEVTDAVCTAGGGTWSSSPCPEANCCDTLTVSQCDFGAPDPYTSGTGSIGHVQSSIGPPSGCTWTINGTWNSNFIGSTPSGTYSLAYDEGTSTWSINGSIPAPYGGTVSGSLVQEACTVQSGTVIDIPISGTHLDYMGGSVPYNGKVRVSFTQTG
jgi:hypothetical protein